MSRRSKSWRRKKSIIGLIPFFILTFVIVCGCGKYKTYPLGGRITLVDGTPLDAVRVSFERVNQMPAISATAITDKDGCYTVGTVGVEDGIPAGEYRVVVSEPGRFPGDTRPRRIHAKYERLETSGLQFTVTGEEKSFDIQLEPK